MRARRFFTVMCGGAMLVASLSATASSLTAGATTRRHASATVSRTDAAGTVWLCRPGIADDPCTFSRATTSVPASGTRTVSTPTSSATPAFDCFYIYPTVSTEDTINSDLTVQPAETDVAVSQASPFSVNCRVWAPMYRQVTDFGLLRGFSHDTADENIAFQSLLAAWKDYMAHYNDHRPVIYIGHSQGSAMLIRLLSSEVDSSATLRARTVSAIIAGGNVAVPTGKTVGATFKHLPLCTSTSETSCVIAYSTFPSQPPLASIFGRPGQGVSLQSGQTQRTGVQIACVNPNRFARATASLTPLFLTNTMTPPAPAITTAWVTYPDLYSATCESSGGATWLQVTDLATSKDTRPVVTETLGPDWGYHVYDINLALGNLVNDVHLQEQAYLAHK